MQFGPAPRIPPLHLIQVARLRQKESTQGCLSFAHCSSVCARSETDPGYSFSWLVPVLSSQGEIELSFSICHLCTWSKLHQMFLKYGSFGALSQWFITEHFLVSFGGLLYTFQCPASRVCGHFSVSQIPLQCSQSCPMVKCLKFYVKWKMVFWLQWFNICQSPCLQVTPSLSILSETNGHYLSTIPVL